MASPHPAPGVDPVTGLPDRVSFDQALAQALKKARKAGSPVSLAVVDIDYFGAINDREGNAAADALLVDLAHALREAVEKAGFAYRFGGDAYALLMPGVEKESAFLLLEAMRGRCDAERTVTVDDAPVAIPASISIGLACYPDDGSREVDLVQRVNEALYRAKVTGRNKVCLAREEKMTTKTSHYMQGQLMGLRRLAERKGIGEAVLLREALNDLLRKYNA